MREGMIAATYNTIVYVDADIVTYPKNIVSLLADPILKGEADFVKSFFDRQAGRVTQLVAKAVIEYILSRIGKIYTAIEWNDSMPGKIF